MGADDVVNGKPDPEPYLLAAERLGVVAADCLVFEDAPAGITSALRAGCTVAQVGGRQRLDPGVSALIQDWRQVSMVESDDGLQLTLLT